MNPSTNSAVVASNPALPNLKAAGSQESGAARIRKDMNLRVAAKGAFLSLALVLDVRLTVCCLTQHGVTLRQLYLWLHHNFLYGRGCSCICVFMQLCFHTSHAVIWIVWVMSGTGKSKGMRLVNAAATSTAPKLEVTRPQAPSVETGPRDPRLSHVGIWIPGSQGFRTPAMAEAPHSFGVDLEVRALRTTSASGFCFPKLRVRLWSYPWALQGLLCHSLYVRSTGRKKLRAYGFQGYGQASFTPSPGRRWLPSWAN